MSIAMAASWLCATTMLSIRCSGAPQLRAGSRTDPDRRRARRPARRASTPAAGPPSRSRTEPSAADPVAPARLLDEQGATAGTGAGTRTSRRRAGTSRPSRSRAGSHIVGGLPRRRRRRGRVLDPEASERASRASHRREHVRARIRRVPEALPDREAGLNPQCPSGQSDTAWITDTCLLPRR